MEMFIPNRFVFQWHITDVCNMRCTHCYQTDYNFIGLEFTDLLKIFNQMQSFLIEKRIKKAHINFTGGEPFLRNDFLKLLKIVKSSGTFTFGILSNGYLPPKPILDELKNLNPSFIQISLEGNKKINDSIRGDGSFEKILEALKVYKTLGIKTILSFTANSSNYMVFQDVVKIARKHGVSKVWTDRYLPIGKSDELQLTTEQFRVLGELILRIKSKEGYHVLSHTQVVANRALQFLFVGGHPYKCSAGINLLAIAANGDLLPCRRLPIVVGNLLVQNLTGLFDNSSLLNNLRKNEVSDDKCKSCHYKLACGGGLKYLSYALSGDFNVRDINCWI